MMTATITRINPNPMYTVAPFLRAFRSERRRPSPATCVASSNAQNTRQRMLCAPTTSKRGWRLYRRSRERVVLFFTQPRSPATRPVDDVAEELSRCCVVVPSSQAGSGATARSTVLLRPNCWAEQELLTGRSGSATTSSSPHSRRDQHRRPRHRREVLRGCATTTSLVAMHDVSARDRATYASACAPV
jgi:hypothetical protein